MSSHVYLLRCNDEFKIGKANSVDTRLVSLQTGNSKYIQLLWKTEVSSESEAFKVENCLHKKFKKYRSRGEWFKIPSEVILQEFPGVELSDWVESKTIIGNKCSTEAALLEDIRILTKLFKSPLTPAMLYNYYVSISQVPMWDLTNDEKVGKELGYSARSVADNRRKLEKAGWILFKVHIHNGIKYGSWFIGREVVESELSRGKGTLEIALKTGVILQEEYNAAVGTR